MTDVLFIILGIAVAAHTVSLLGRHKRPIKAAGLSMLAGVASLAAASAIMGLFGMTLAVNFITVFISLSLSVSGVFLLIFYMLIV